VTWVSAERPKKPSTVPAYFLKLYFKEIFKHTHFTMTSIYTPKWVTVKQIAESIPVLL
jgi:hypothetical protein